MAYRDSDSTKGDAEIERLITTYPSQRMEALKARSAVIAREAAGGDLAEIDGITSSLPEGDKGFLKETPRVRALVTELADANRRLDAADRPFIREPYAETLISKIEAFHSQVSGFREPLASEFRKAADSWLTRAHAELEQVRRVTEREPTSQMFRAGDPVDRSQEAFVPRMGVIGQVERQLTLATGCPGLLIWAFVGSHPITELTNAEWPSYLVSAQTIEIPPFSLAETRLLLTDPLKHSPLYARDTEKRPRFDPDFWGEGGIDWIQKKTAGWPHLVQLLASTAVDLANESEADALDQNMLEQVVEKSIVSGDVVLRQLLHGECKTETEKSYVAGFRRTPTQAPPEDETALQSLRHRQIVSEEGDVWRLKAPLMQRWLEARG